MISMLVSDTVISWLQHRLSSQQC